MQRGFTLIETFVAITILVIAALGPLALLSRAISDSTYAKNQITAFYLAQEGVELVINRRDGNKITLTDTYDTPDLTWLTGLVNPTGPCDATSGCQTSANDIGQFEPCGSDGCLPIQRGETGFYYYDPDVSNEPTIFTRKIEVQPLKETLANGTVVYKEAKVISTITWNDKATPRTFPIVTYITK